MTKETKEVEKTEKVEKKEKVNKKKHECKCGEECNCKKGKTGRVFFVIGLVIVLCAISFAVGIVSGAKFIYEDDMIEEVEKEEDKTELKDEENLELEKELSKVVNELMLIDSYNRSFDSVDNLSNIELLNFGFRLALGTNWDDSTVVTLEEINVIVKKYFNRTVTGENIPCDITLAGQSGWEDTHPPMFVYNSDKKNFTYNENHYGHGGIGTNVLNRVVEVEKVEDNVYTIEVKKAFSINEFFYSDYYPTYQDAYEQSNWLFGAPECDDSMGCLEYDPAEDFSNTPDSKLVSYKYTFEKTNGGYVLTNYTFGK